MFKTDNAMNNDVFIYGDVGAGKTHLIIEEIKSYLEKKEGKLYIIDLYGEYKNLAEEYNGEIISLNPTSKNKVNPFYIRDKKDNEILYDKIDDLKYLFYNDFSNIELNYIKRWLVEIYSSVEELTFSYLMDSINQFRIKTEIEIPFIEWNKILFTEWQCTTMQYIDSYLDCKNNIDISTINKNLVIFDLSHITNKRERSIVTYSVLYLIWEELMLNDELYKSRILIDNINLVDEGVDYYLNRIMKKSRINNCGIILSTNNYKNISNDNIKKTNCLMLSGTQVIMKIGNIGNGLIDKIKYDMNLSDYEIEQLKNLSVGEYIRFPKLRESESHYEEIEKKYSYFISYYFEKERLFKIKKDSGVSNIDLNIDYEIKSYSDILEATNKIRILNGYSKVAILNYKLIQYDLSSK